MIKRNPRHLAQHYIDAISHTFKDGATKFTSEIINDRPNKYHFTVNFLAYNYFWVGFTCEIGLFQVYIICNKNTIEFEDLFGFWDNTNLEEWTIKLDKEIRLRIPDKFLYAKGYNEKHEVISTSKFYKDLSTFINLGIPYKTSYPVLYKDKSDGNMYMASFISFYSNDDVLNNHIERPSVWSIADLQTGEIIDKYDTNTKEFSDLPYNKYYEFDYKKFNSISPEKQKEIFTAFDEVRRDYLNNDKINRRKYKDYLKLVSENYSSDYKKFYDEISA